ncbi:MAG: methyltransferase domain-containing protein [Saprospiraceae bacterium]|nr:methyltransferase domain-containing protein [Saprospiraceae bacterium]
MNPSTTILESWHANADNWIQTIDHQEIESRKLVTNQAIIETLTNLNPKTVLDIGCGEGWLARAIAARGADVTGVDAIPVLIENAKAKGAGKFLTATYLEIVAGDIFSRQLFDLIVINFALIDQEETDLLIFYLPNIIKPAGHLVIQTLHPLSVIGNIDYKSSWQPGSWNGMKRDFVQPYDWFFRTLGDWIRLFKSAKLNLVDLIEPLHPSTQQPASIIFVLQRP